MTARSANSGGIPRSTSRSVATMTTGTTGSATTIGPSGISTTAGNGDVSTASEDTTSSRLKRNDRRHHPVPDRLIRVPHLGSTRALRGTGVSHRALDEQKRVSRIHHGVYGSTGDGETLWAPGWADEAWIDLYTRARALQLIRPDAVISGTSAARLLGWPVPRDRGNEVLTVTTEPATARVERPGVRTRVSERCTTRQYYGVTVNSRHWILAELARDLGVAELTAVVDTIVGTWHGPPETDLDTLRTVMGAVGRFVGAPRMRAALTAAREDVDSPRETRLRLSIVAAGLPEPEVHPTIPVGGYAVHPDLGYPDLRIAIEYEGDEHRTDPQRWAQDIERYEILQQLGWIVLRVTARTSMPRFLERLRVHLATASAT